MEQPLIPIVEALLFASDAPLSVKRLKGLIEDSEEKEIRKAIKALNERYEKSSSALQVVEIAGGYQIVTRKEWEPYIQKMVKTRAGGRLTQKALETLAIIAYKQPITKQEVEAIRGVNVDGVMRTLIERNLITVKGRKKALGNPLLYGTTPFFLNYFGLRSLKDLPKLKEIDELLKSDDRFLEGLDQVEMQKLLPEELGLTSMLPVDQKEQTQASTEKQGDSEHDEAE